MPSEHAVAVAEQVEQAVAGRQAKAWHADTTAAGFVRPTSVPILVNRLLVPVLGDLASHPAGVRMEMVADHATSA